MGLLIRLLRATLGLCALLLVLAALYVSLGRELVPLVAEYRDEVQARAQAAVGMPLSIGHLEGGWSGFDPILTAHDVQLGDGCILANSVALEQCALPQWIDDARQPVVLIIIKTGGGAIGNQQPQRRTALALPRLKQVRLMQVFADEISRDRGKNPYREHPAPTNHR